MRHATEPAEPALGFQYRFRFKDGSAREFLLELDPSTLALRRPEAAAEQPPWTRLGYYQCSNCPLQESQQPRCPIAAHLVGVVEFFGDRVSVERVDVAVETQGRTYSKHTSLQEGLSSLVGIVMVTSGCPILNKLRPMVATHLPFMTPEESTYRMISMYLMAQHFTARDGGSPDWRLDGLVDFLSAIRLANVGFTARLNSLSIRDASLNAVSTLSALGELTSISIVEDGLARWQRVFLEHFGGR